MLAALTSPASSAAPGTQQGLTSFCQTEKNPKEAIVGKENNWEIVMWPEDTDKGDEKLKTTFSFSFLKFLLIDF